MVLHFNESKVRLRFCRVALTVKRSVFFICSLSRYANFYNLHLIFSAFKQDSPDTLTGWYVKMNAQSKDWYKDELSMKMQGCLLHTDLSVSYGIRITWQVSRKVFSKATHYQEIWIEVWASWFWCMLWQSYVFPLALFGTRFLFLNSVLKVGMMNECIMTQFYIKDFIIVYESIRNIYRVCITYFKKCLSSWCWLTVGWTLVRNQR